jgi:uncharacterized protein HemY
MELIRAYNLPLAQEYILKAQEMCPFDPLIYNELGVIAFKNKNYSHAVDMFETVLKLAKNNLTQRWEATLFNILGIVIERCGESTTHILSLSFLFVLNSFFVNSFFPK